MSGFGNFLAGALGGGGSAVSSIASRYIDEEIQRNRQQAFLDMQRASNLQQAKDMDEFQNNPTRRERLRVEERKDSASMNQVALEGKIAEATNPRLMDARRANLRAEAAILGEVAAQQVKTNASDKTYLNSVRAVSLADPRVQAQINQARASIAQSDAHTKLLGIQGQAAELDLSDRKKFDALFDRYDKVLNDKSMDDKSRGVELGKLTDQLNVMRAKIGRGAAGAQESDTVKVTEEEMLPGGGTRKTERTEKRKPTPGGGSEQGDPIMATLLANRAASQGVQPSQAATTAPSAASTRAPTQRPTTSASSTWPELNSIDRQLYSDLEPLAAAYQDAQEKFRAAAKSGDPEAIDYWQKPLIEAKQKLRQAANSRLGNGAQRYFSTIGL